MTHIILLIHLIFSSPTVEVHTLTVTVDNIKTMEGSIEVGLFNQDGKFLEKNEAYKSVSVKVTSITETVVIENLPKGTYAISLYHDINGNGICDRNFMGIPKEPYGFSNNFKPKFSAPTFADCTFDVEANHSMTIDLIH